MAARPIVTLYTQMLCAYCHRARKLLGERGIEYEETDVTGNAAAREAMARRAGGARTVPQVFVGDVHVGGSDDLARAAESGELDRLLAGG